MCKSDPTYMDNDRVEKHLLYVQKLLNEKQVFKAEIYIMDWLKLLREGTTDV